MKKYILAFMVAAVLLLGITAKVNAEEYTKGKLVILTKDKLAGGLTIKTDVYITDLVFPAGIYTIISRNNNSSIGFKFNHDGEIITIPKGDYYIMGITNPN